MEKRWLLNTDPAPVMVQALAEGLGVVPRIAKLLIQRGITTTEAAYRFFHPNLEYLHDPFLMADMDKAVSRLCRASEENEKILVYGDYDVDGTTAVALVHSFLSAHGLSTTFYIPDRYKEGYGFSGAGVEFAREGGFSLIITLDCGIKDRDNVLKAAAYGIDVIVCDHHNASVIPPALAVLDPKRPDCNYPYKGLSGCGVGFKLLQGYSVRKGIPLGSLFTYLDLVTISIGADIVPLTGENRILAKFGLDRLQTSRRPGIAAMLNNAGFKKSSLNISDVVFILAPRINAAGRIFSGRRAVELLIAATEEEAMTVAQAIEENNKTRRELDKDITREALQLIQNDPFYAQSFSTVVYHPSWHKGVVGIVASRLVEAWYKPTIVLTESNGKLTGSARSIDGIDLYDVLGKCSDLLEQFGGHTMAAGLALKPELFQSFRLRFDEVVAEALGHKRPMPYLMIDAELQWDDLSMDFYHQLEWFQPFGPENMKPVFLSRNLVDTGQSRVVGATGTHLKLNIRPHDRQQAIDGIAFEMGHMAGFLKEGNAADLVYTLEENEWNGRVSLQMMVRDIKPSVAETPLTPAS
ncbi:MAG: single-stranded-DNA-specific exonuclease RecJ [Flavobacteriales bacterium]|nr:single-stranded-DNA-specific exonuclease RecJ [Flavobacteriales bacterium]